MGLCAEDAAPPQRGNNLLQVNIQNNYYNRNNYHYGDDDRWRGDAGSLGQGPRLRPGQLVRPPSSMRVGVSEALIGDAKMTVCKRQCVFQSWYP